MSDSLWQRFFNFIIIGIVVAGFLALVVGGAWLIADTTRFWARGVEVPAKIIELERRSSGRASSSYSYRLEVNSRVRSYRFRQELPVGRTVSVLVVNGDASRIMLGTEESSWFELYSNTMGGPIWGAGTLAFFVWALVRGPGVIRHLVINRHNYRDKSDGSV